MGELLNSSIVLLCAAVFLSRILDVSFGTLRMVNVVKGRSVAAMAMGFCETFVWFIFARQALQSASGLAVAVFYAGGYATGTLVGTLIANRLVRGKVEMQIVTSGHNKGIAEAIQKAGYGVTVLDLNNTRDGQSRFLLLVSTDCKEENRVRDLVRSLDEDAFITVSETKVAYNGYYSVNCRNNSLYARLSGGVRK